MLAILPFSTTIVDTWSGTDLTQVGPIYPFVGSEFILWIVGLAFWIWFHVSQIRIEDRELEADAEAARRQDVLKKVFAEEAE